MPDEINIVASLYPDDVAPEHIEAVANVIRDLIGDHDGVYDVARVIAEQVQVSAYYGQPLTRNILSYQTSELSHYVDDVEVTEKMNEALLDAVCALYAVK